MSITTDRSSTHSFRFSTGGNEMKPIYWILAALIVFGWGAYDEMREVHRAAQLPVAVVR